MQPDYSSSWPGARATFADAQSKRSTPVWAVRSGVVCFLVATVLLFARTTQAQERPYFVTYSQDMEEPGNLELETFNVIGNPRGGNPFIGSDVELEYGLKTWWTTEFYLDGQATANDSTIFTGFRWENRVRPWLGEHRVNPVLYAEFEDISADKTLRDVVGHDGGPDFLDRNGISRLEKERELELKLILGSDVHGWNFSENFITEKNLQRGDAWEFGYAIGVSRPLQMAANAHDCVFCREKFAAGAELYGGLGTSDGFGTRQTSHYAGPTLNWTAPNGMTIGMSPQFGLNNYSVPVLFRFSVSYEIQEVFAHWHK
jgi:hypothetical protein